MRVAGICALLVFLACKSGSSHCPTPAELTRAGASADEAAIVVERCKADGWSEATGRCLKDARDDAALEGCLKSLTPEQGKQLAAAFAPLSEDSDEREAKDALATFQRKLAELSLERVTAAPGCASYRKAIDELAVKIAGCAVDTAALRLFGLHQQVVKQAGELGAITDAGALAAACARHEAAYRQEYRTVCDGP